MAYSGTFRPSNPQKYVGDYRNIIYRSSWECRVMNWLDKNPNIVSWASEEIIIPYVSPVDGKWHRYYPDFVVKVKNKDNTTRTMMLEVKPKKQTQRPIPQRRVTQKYITEVATWGVNQAKWKYAEDYCKDRGWEFRVLTEDDLGL